MTGQADSTTGQTIREIAARDGEEIAVRADNQDWIVSWHPPLTPPDGTPHGAAGLCVTGNGEIVLISADGEHWGLPGGQVSARRQRS